MPREPRPAAGTWSLLAVAVVIAGLPPGGGMLYVFSLGRDPERWETAANDER